MWYEVLYRVLSIVNYIVLIIIGLPLLIQIFNVLFCWVKKKTYPKSDKKCRIAYLLPAHNESKVIFDSVKDLLDNQDYDKNKYDVFVVADNCTDKTAELAKQAGAIVLIHNDPDPSHHMALYPLKYGINHILKLDKYDLVVHLDADNHVCKDYSSLMNDAYQCGHDFLRPYEGSINGPKNFFTKACTMFYSFDSRYGSRMRERLGVSAHVNGGGAVMSTRMLKETGGYDCHTISDDAEFCFNRILEGRKAHFVEDAVVYEEMPETFKDTVNRNMRIGSGGIKLLKSKLWKMFFGFFKTGRLSYMEMFLTYIFLFITPLLCIWMPLFYIYNFVFLGLIENGVIQVGFLYSNAYYHVLLWNTILSIIGVVGGLFILFGFVQAFLLVILDYKKLGAKKRSEMIDAGLLFPAYLFVYAVTICIGTLSKPKWKDQGRNINLTMENKYSVEVKNLYKYYGDFLAVDNITFYVDKGTLFAFLGVNGAGKSTTINIISTILKKSSGKVFVEGYDLDTEYKKIKNEIGIVFQNSVLDQQLTVYQNLKFRIAFYAMSKEQRKKQLKSIIELLDLKSILHKQICQLSGGQKRRVDIARAMLHSPRLLILDEPTTGLDPKTRQTVWKLIDKIRTETGMTVFLTTHYLEEAEKAAYVVVMDKGKIVAKGLPVELKNQYSSDYILSYGKKNLNFEKALSKNKESYKYDYDRKGYIIYHKGNENLKDLLKKYDKYLNDFEVLKGTMDDAFINITGRKQEELANEENK